MVLDAGICGYKTSHSASRGGKILKFPNRDHINCPPNPSAPGKHPSVLATKLKLTRVDNDLTDILQDGRFPGNVNPACTEGDDELSRLKTQCMQLATQVLHLQTQIEAGHFKLQSDSRHSGKSVAERAHLSAHLEEEEKVSAQTKDQFGSGSSIATNPWSYRIRPRPSAVSSSSTTKGQDVKSDLTKLFSHMETASSMKTAETPTLDLFLKEVRSTIQNEDSEKVANILQIEPPLGPAYVDLSRELRAVYPAGKDHALRETCQRVLPTDADSKKNAWESFAGYLVEYLHFLRDYSPGRSLLKINTDIKRLLNMSVICLGDTTFGFIILANVVSLGKLLARFSIGLDQSPELVSELRKDFSARTTSDVREKLMLIEDAANILREAFIKCLSDRSGPSGAGRHALPHGKRTGIYRIGNLCLKLLFHCGKVSSATTMFMSLDAQSPLLSHYPASQRVTYLYYLGRYFFANNHFYRAQLALQAAYDQCHAQAVKNRRLILTYLIASNICLGRFPSSKLLLRRESTELAKHYLPLCRIIASGHLARFHQYLSLNGAHGQWFLRKRLLLQLRNRCELLVWRSLVRRVFVEVGYPGGEDNKTPFLRLSLLQAAARSALQPDRQLEASLPSTMSASKLPFLVDRTTISPDFDFGTEDTEIADVDFAGMEEAAAAKGFDLKSGTYREPAEHRKRPSTTNSRPESKEDRPSMEEVECVMAALIQQDLIFGFLTHSNPRFAIPGAKTRGPVAVGFPSVWSVIEARKQGHEVPGWVEEPKQKCSNGFEASKSAMTARAGGGVGAGGRVINLSGARPVGAGTA